MTEEGPFDSFGAFMLSKLLSKPSNEIAIVYNDESQEVITYGDLLKQSISLSVNLTKIGVRRGDVIALVSGNCLEFVSVVLATVFLGATLHPISDGLTFSELKQLFIQSKPSVIFCSKWAFIKILMFKNDCDSIKHIAILGDDSDEILNFSRERSEDFNGVDKFQVDSTIKASEDCIIFNSSGTTGSCKCVMHSQDVSIKNILLYSNPNLFGLTKNDILVAYMPLQHGYGFSLLMSALVVGCQILMIKKFEPVRFLELISEKRVPRLFLVPTLMHFFRNNPLVNQYDLSSVKEIFCSSAPLRRDVEESVKMIFGLTHIRQFYALSEVCVVSLTPKDISIHQKGSSGRIISGVEVRIKDPETLKVKSDGHIGEIFVRSPYIMKGYVHNETSTKEAFDSNNFLRTGDLGYCKNGYIYITGRFKEIFKYKGFQVPVSEIENLLMRMEGIEEVAVINKPDERYGDLTTAVIVKAKDPSISITETDVQDFVSRSLSEQKWLHGGVIFVEHIPKSETGKVMKMHLREILFAGHV